MQKPSQTAIADALGLTRASISKLKKQGMPVSSVEAAIEWREANLCFDGRRVELSLSGTRRPRGPSPAALVERVNAMAPLAEEALKAGRFDLVEAELRQALCEVPDVDADQVAMSFKVWDALVADVLKALDVDVAGDSRSDKALSKADIRFMASFWLRAARGLVRVASSDSKADDPQTADRFN